MLLQVPVDFERLPEFRRLARLCGERLGGPMLAEALATALWMRLWVELAYLAGATNQPGQLAPEDAALFVGSLQSYCPESAHPMALLEECGLLRPWPGGGWTCDRFARLNPHFAGDFKSREKRGQEQSLITRWQKDVIAESSRQALLLPGEWFKRRDGTPLSATDGNRVRNLINQLDRILMPDWKGRSAAQWTEGLIADAAAVVDARSQEWLMAFFKWLMEHRGKSCVHKSTEPLLAHFEDMAALMAAEQVE